MVSSFDSGHHVLLDLPVTSLDNPGCHCMLHVVLGVDVAVLPQACALHQPCLPGY